MSAANKQKVFEEIRDLISDQLKVENCSDVILIRVGRPFLTAKRI